MWLPPACMVEFHHHYYAEFFDSLFKKETWTAMDWHRIYEDK